MASSHPHVLLVVTSHDQLGTNGEKTGFWLEELAAPYIEFTKAGAHVTIASPKGGKPPVDPKSEKSPPEEVVAFLKDEAAVAKLNNSVVLDKVNVDEFNAIFFVGGHGAVYDLAASLTVEKLISTAWVRALLRHVCSPLILHSGKAQGGGRRLPRSRRSCERQEAER